MQAVLRTPAAGVAAATSPRRTSATTFALTPDNRLVFGGRARFAMSNPRSDEKSGRILRATLAEVFPELRGVRIDYCWGGMVDMTADRLPRAGEDQGCTTRWDTAATACRCRCTWAR